MLSISTAWNYKEDMDVKKALLEIKKAGLDALELGYRLRRDQLEEFLRLIPELGFSVNSVHNFCPVPNDHPSPRHPSNYYRLSSIDEAERRLAVTWTKTAIDTAVKTGAKAVVIHAGMIEAAWDLSMHLIENYKLGRADLPEFAAMREDLVREREQAKGPFIDAVVKSLGEVLPYATDRGLIIGLETRYYPMEIPNFQEIGLLLDKFHTQGLWYWHDMGHAEANSRLGLTPHIDFLKTYESRLKGFHVHGVKVMRDHHAPFSGDFDMEIVLPFMKEKINVIESHHYASFDQIKTAVKKLRERLY